MAITVNAPHTQCSALMTGSDPSADRQARIARAFSRAAPRYDALAGAQQHIGRRLWESLPLSAHSIVDVGCGTGYWTQRLAERYADAAVIGIDIAQGMLAQAKQRSSRIDWRQGDAVALPVERASVELIFSNLAVQWCSDVGAVMSEFARVLVPGGRVVLTTLLPGTLNEVAFAWQRPDAFLDYLSGESYYQIATAAGLRPVRTDEYSERFFYPDMSAVMASIKGVGAQVARPGATLTRRDLAAARTRFETLRAPQGLPVSYRCLALVLVADSTSSSAFE